MKLDVTKAQLEAIKSAADDMSSMIGGGDDESDKEWTRIVKHIDNMLERNGLKPREYK